jgi:cell division protein FtsB
MFQKLKSFVNHRWLSQFRDVRVVGLVAFLVVVLMVSYSGSKVIQRNYELQKQISQLRQQNAVQQLANNNVKLENQYFNSNQYLELKARQDFGLGAPGETELIVSKDVAMAYVTSAPVPKPTMNPAAQQPGYQHNFQAWIDFFLHRPGEI